MTTLTFDKDEIFETDNDKSRQKMSANGGILKKNNVRLVLLVHGTFAGNDALGLFDLFEPIIGEMLANKLKNEGKNLIDTLAKDVGNYTQDYADVFGTALANGIACELLKWSSGNYHFARLKGTLILAQKLAEKISQNNILANERILLLGHSHAGQLFALLTTFLENGEKAQLLYNTMAKSKYFSTKKQELLSNLEKIKTVHLDIVTFGTPVRYAWGRYEKYRLLAIVNHRSPVEISGLLSTRDGDYVQQWGAEGTDLLATDEKELNDELDAVLDKGRDVSALLNSLKHKDRKQPHYANDKIVGKTLLVDYKDNASSLLEHLDITHCVKTLFGHGVYTETKAMLFNMDIIVKNWYS